MNIKTLLSLSMVVILILFLLVSTGKTVKAADTILLLERNTISIVATGAQYYERPVINNSGEIVWSQSVEGIYQILSSLRGHVSSGSNDRDPDINDAGEIIWRYGDGGSGPNGIYSNVRGVIYASTGIDPYYDSVRINNSGEIVWSDKYGDIWSNTLGLLSDEGWSNHELEINNLGELVYQSYYSSSGNVYDILSTERGFITNNSNWESSPDINDVGEIVWEQYSSGGNSEIWSNIGGLISSNSGHAWKPRINNSGEIVWYAFDGTDYEIFSNVRGQITNNNTSDILPDINDAGTITWIADIVPSVGGLVTGVSPRKIMCKNETTTQRVVINDGASAWDCEAAGLNVTPGDMIRQIIRGVVTSPTSTPMSVGGSVNRVSPMKVMCKNVTTTQSVVIKDGASTWDCGTAGLSVTPGNTIEQGVIGAAY